MSEDKKLTQEELKEEGKKELLKEQQAVKKAEAGKRDEKIKEIQKKKKKTEEDKAFLKREMPVRAKDNYNAPRDLDKMYPSQMTLIEMEKYCKDNEIEVKKEDTTVKLRLRIKAFRNPAQAERLRLLEQRPIENKIVR